MESSDSRRNFEPLYTGTPMLTSGRPASGLGVAMRAAVLRGGLRHPLQPRFPEIGGDPAGAHQRVVGVVGLAVDLLQGDAGVLHDHHAPGFLLDDPGDALRDLEPLAAYRGHLRVVRQPAVTQLLVYRLQDLVMALDLDPFSRL